MQSKDGNLLRLESDCANISATNVHVMAHEWPGKHAPDHKRSFQKCEGKLDTCDVSLQVSSTAQK